MGSYATTTISIADSLFEKNSATDGGGLYISSDYSLTVSRTVFHENEAGMYGFGGYGGGAVLESNGVATFTSCNFTGGFAWNGGGGEAFFFVGIHHFFVAEGVQCYAWGRGSLLLFTLVLFYRWGRLQPHVPL